MDGNILFPEFLVTLPQYMTYLYTWHISCTGLDAINAMQHATTVAAGSKQNHLLHCLIWLIICIFFKNKFMVQTGVKVVLL